MRVFHFQRQIGGSAGARLVDGQRELDPIRCRQLIHSYDSEFAGEKRALDRERSRKPSSGRTDLHGSDLTIDRRSVPGLSDSEIKERKETKDVCQGSVYSVVVCGVVIADVVEFRD